MKSQEGRTVRKFQMRGINAQVNRYIETFGVDRRVRTLISDSTGFYILCAPSMESQMQGGSVSKVLKKHRGRVKAVFKSPGKARK